MSLRQHPACRSVHLLTAGLLLAAFWAPAFAEAQDRNGADSTLEDDRGPTPPMPGEAPARTRGEQPSAGPDATLSPEKLSELQRLLNDLDFHSGPADGIPGPRTRAGIKEFQRFAGLAADGEPTAMLLAKIRAYARTARSAGFRIAPAEPGTSTLPTGAAGLSPADETLSRRVAAAFLRARSGSANPAVIQTLRRAHRMLQRPRLERIFDNDFFGATAVPRPWRTAGQGFAPHRRLGMRAGGDEHGPVLQALHDTWVGLSTAIGLSDRTPETAELYGARPFAGPFELTVGFRLAEDAGRLMIGPYRDVASRKDGYRLVYSPEERHRLALVRIENGRQTVVARRTLPIRLNTGILHELTWWRTADGRMELAIGETEMFSVRDGGSDAAFNGLTIAVQNGGFSIAHVRLHAAPARSALADRRRGGNPAGR